MHNLQEFFELCAALKKRKKYFLLAEVLAYKLKVVNARAHGNFFELLLLQSDGEKLTKAVKKALAK